MLVSHITKQLIGPAARDTVTINANDIQKQYRLITKANEGGIIFFISFENCGEWKSFNKRTTTSTPFPSLFWSNTKLTFCPHIKTFPITQKDICIGFYKL